MAPRVKNTAGDGLGIAKLAGSPLEQALRKNARPLVQPSPGSDINAAKNENPESAAAPMPKVKLVPHKRARGKAKDPSAPPPKRQKPPAAAPPPAKAGGGGLPTEGAQGGIPAKPSAPAPPPAKSGGEGLPAGVQQPAVPEPAAAGQPPPRRAACEMAPMEFATPTPQAIANASLNMLHFGFNLS